MSNTRIALCFAAPAAFAALILAAPAAHAATYYVDAQAGSDTAAGTSPSSAWRTLSHVNSAAVQSQLHPGDSVLLHRGQSFAGPLVVGASGSATAPVTYGAYGNGARPMVSGMFDLTAWSRVSTGSGPGVYQADCATCVAPVRMVTVDGTPVAMGRYPNADVPNGGYLTAQSGTLTTVTDPALSAAGVNWTGAEVVLRKQHYVLDHHPITAQSGGTLTFDNQGSTIPARAGFGYFLENDRRTLDAPGEWYFDPATHRVLMYFDAAGPSAHAVQVATVDRLVDLSQRNDVTLDGLALEGANGAVVYAYATARVRLHDCDVRLAGTDGVFASQSDGTTVDASTIAWAHSDGLELSYSATHATLSNSTVSDVGRFAGMGQSGGNTYAAVFIVGDGARITANTVARAGYHALSFQGSDVEVRDNVVDGFGLTKDDCGGIYTVHYGGATETARTIADNVVLHGTDAPAGTDGSRGWANGIYLDDNSPAVTVTGNALAYNDGAGVFLHNAHEITLEGNTAFANGVQLRAGHGAGGQQDPVRNITLRGNTLVSSAVTQPVVRVESDTDDVAQLGTFSLNRYARPLDDGFTLVRAVDGQQPVGFTLARWQARYGLDADSSTSAVSVAPYAVRSVLGANLFANPGFDANANGAGAYGADGAAVRWAASSGLDGGAAEYVFASPTAAVNPSNLTLALGAITAGQTYLLRFSSLGTDPLAFPFEAYLRDQAGHPRSEAHFGGATNGRTEHELLFTAAASEPTPLLDFDLNESDAHAPFWFDNVQLLPVDAAITDPATVFRFEYNPTDAVTTVALDAPYLDVAGNQYDTSVDVPPHGARVLVRASASALSITSPGTAMGAIGAVFSYAITTRGMATHFGAAGLPAGLSVDASSGVISGAPAAAGTFAVQLAASNAHDSATRALSLTVLQTGQDAGAPDAGRASDAGLDAGSATLDAGRAGDAAVARADGASDDAAGSGGGGTGGCGCTAPGRSAGDTPGGILALGAAAWATGRRRRRRC